jgi:hypothetical protein
MEGIGSMESELIIHVLEGSGDVHGRIETEDKISNLVLNLFQFLVVLDFY